MATLLFGLVMQQQQQSARRVFVSILIPLSREFVAPLLAPPREREREREGEKAESFAPSLPVERTETTETMTPKPFRDSESRRLSAKSGLISKESPKQKRKYPGSKG